MRYIIIIYALFLLAFDFFADNNYLWDIAYFTVQYYFAACVSLYFVFHGKLSRMPYLVAAAFFLILAIFELSMLRFDQAEYVQTILDPSPLLSCGIIFIVIILMLTTLRKFV